MLLGRRGFRVGRKPGGKVLALFDVVGAQDAAHVGVVFGVAVGFAREVGALELGDVVGEVGVPGGHLGYFLFFSLLGSVSVGAGLCCVT